MYQAGGSFYGIFTQSRDLADEVGRLAGLSLGQAEALFAQGNALHQKAMLRASVRMV